MEVFVVELPVEVEEDFDPLPLIALRIGALQYSPYKLGLPNGERYDATWEIEEEVVLDGAFVRFADFPPKTMHFRYPIALRAGDQITVHVRIG